jgi:diguanylate cyclase (GGDEF)-like protein/PAS domain S-box-containing protein
MKRISISVRLAICLALLSLCALLFAHLLGMFPDTRRVRLEGRVALCEALAINCSMLANRGDIRGIERNLQASVTRNPDVLSAALRGADQQMLVKVGNHEQHWRGEGKSSDVNIYVPITAENRSWGTIEVAFRHASLASRHSLLPTFLEFAIFVTACNILAFMFWLRRVLMHLDPSRVVPQRVRSALDTLAEGLLVLDDRGRIVLANKAFAGTVGKEAGDLTGQPASDLSWVADEKISHPWLETLEQRVQRIGVAMKLRTPDSDERAFMVNASPILGEDGKNKGVLASFDDVTDLETKKSELLRILRALKQSREEIQEQNQQLKRLATLDPLTECLNRRSFFPQFDNHWQQALAEGLPLSGVMVDIDHFKSINDDHGHARGDQVLKGVAECLRAQFGEDGLVCRFGGEEFCVLLSGFDLERAVARAEQVRAAIERIHFGAFTVTASLGVSSIDLGAADPQALLEQADKCLYIAKRNGRNQVVRYSRDMEEVEVDESKLRRRPTSETAAPQSHIPFPAVASLTSALAYRHAETAEHSSRVADICVAMARGLMPVSESYILEIAALLHDIGKIGVPDAILLKPGKLTEGEWRVMKANEQIGVEIVSSAFDYPPLVDIIRYHKAPFSEQAGVTHMPHGDQLPLGARILAIADAYDAMKTEKMYRPALSNNEAFAELRRCAGVQFDPQVVERLIDVVSTEPNLTIRAAQNISRQTAIRVATQIEELARALDEQDLTAIEALSARLQSTAACSGAEEVEQLAARIHESVSNGDDASELFELTMQLMDLCRAAQRAQFGPGEVAAL